MIPKRETIFLVDDNKTNLVLGKEALDGAYNVYTFNSGARLLNMLEKIMPDLILLDVKMPEMDGYEVINILKSNAQTARIPVIFLTALSSEETELKGLSLGAIDYITKPFSPTLLLKRIEVHLLVEAQRLELMHYNNNLEKMVEEKTEAVVELKNVILRTMAEIVGYRDEVTGGHIDRIQRYIKTLLVAMRKYKVYKEEVVMYDEYLVLQSSALHDVGKISIRDSILFKKGKLTPHEYDQMKAHTIFGENLILRIKQNTTDNNFLEYARVFAISHHERWDGSGYPKGLKGYDIPLLGRLMAIADVYDALVSDRPYKSALPHEEAAKNIIDGRGSYFDPALVDLFIEVSREFEIIATMSTYP